MAGNRHYSAGTIEGHHRTLIVARITLATAVVVLATKLYLTSDTSAAAHEIQWEDNCAEPPLLLWTIVVLPLSYLLLVIGYFSRRWIFFRSFFSVLGFKGRR